MSLDVLNVSQTDTVNQFAMVKCKCICHTAFAGNVVSQFAPLLEEVSLNQVNSNSVGFFLLCSTGIIHVAAFFLQWSVVLIEKMIYGGCCDSDDTLDCILITIKVQFINKLNHNVFNNHYSNRTIHNYMFSILNGEFIYVYSSKMSKHLLWLW